ncbi:hypothetical protein EHO60_03945 [Leptospira fletcheri]|uniref:TonB C-terminal domain-containing protein n=1 Tax=Leptospira fletcheri TaxID=2484981 RepID=A0A4R9GFR2_9LEPT|nr:AgmX/PglI C-terminal domain-containing protein [Leptospira fletcheri]TGK11468.1 hypothetical protein EHO60_03945 [Leptospira fletcheri]
MKNRPMLSIGMIALCISVLIVLAFQIHKMNEHRKMLEEGLARLEEKSLHLGKGDSYLKNEVRNTILKRRKEIKDCYEAYLATKPKIETGDLKVDWKIDKQGKALRPEEVLSTFFSDDLSRCVTERISEWSFPPPITEKYVFHTFSFKKR